VLAGNNPGYSAVMSPFAEQLFDPKDTQSFAELIVRNLKDPAARAAAAGKQKAYVKDFDVDVICEVLLNEYASKVQR
jgi:glycosyltransferase involved in cell wall biosynthesis